MSSRLSTRDQILDAAEELFAAHGFAKTTIKQIAARAGINSALLYYYFENKDSLYLEVLRRLIQELATTAHGGLDEASTPEDGIRQLVRAQAGFLLGHPNAPRLIARELIEHGGRHAESLVPIVATGPFTRLCQLIRSGQKDGSFRRDVDPRYGAISTIAQVAYVALARPIVGQLLGHHKDGPTAEELERYAAHAGEFAVLALSARGPAATGSTV